MDAHAALAQAQRAWALVSAELDQARSLAEGVLKASTDHAARSIAHRSLGLAAMELGNTESCLLHMQAALSETRGSGVGSELVAEAEMGVAVAQHYLGERRMALVLSGRAVRRAPNLGRLALQRALILERLGELTEATAAYDHAERLAEAQGDQAALARVWCNRGVMRIYGGDLPAARADLERARTVCEIEGLTTLAGPVEANLGYLAAREGKIVEALGLLDRMTPEMASYGGMRLGIHELDRCETLLLAGLSGEAVTAGRDSIAALDGAGVAVELAEARVITAQAALLAHDLDAASAEASRALGPLRRRGATSWAALAEEVVVRATWQSGGRTPALAARAAKVAAALDEAGWTTSAASARILAARIELALGRRDRAAAQLQHVRDTPRSPVGLRIQARAATALLRREAGDRRGARAALRSGWNLLERHRATLGATELRAGATAHVAEIVDIALDMAIEDRRPREVLTWAERGRAGTLTPRATAPPPDPELAKLLGELRVVAAEADAAAKRGDDPRALVRRQAQIEERVRGRARLLPPEAAGTAAVAIEPAAILAALGDRALIEYIVSGDELWAVVGARGRYTLRRICPVAQIADEADALRVTLRRLAFGSPVPQLRAAARAGAHYARDRLRHLLFTPIADLIGGRRRIIIPMGALHAVPWSALHDPGEPYVVAPSATLWAHAHAQPASRQAGRRLLVAGPRLAEADAEIAAIATTSGESAPATLTGAGATVDAVRAAMAGADLAHLACHGRFRADNPLFSSLELHDGALSVFELERLDRAPGRIILSACDAGLSAVHPGDELLGLTAALLRMGTTGLVASVLPVPDAATRHLMEALHEELTPGMGLAEALAAARTRLDPARDDHLVASWAFQVLGSG